MLTERFQTYPHNQKLRNLKKAKEILPASSFACLEVLAIDLDLSFAVPVLVPVMQPAVLEFVELEEQQQVPVVEYPSNHYFLDYQSLCAKIQSQIIINTNNSFFHDIPVPLKTHRQEKVQILNRWKIISCTFMVINSMRQMGIINCEQIVFHM